IVHPITNHRHGMRSRCQPLYVLQLFLRQQLGSNFVYSSFLPTSSATAWASPVRSTVLSPMDFSDRMDSTAWGLSRSATTSVPSNWPFRATKTSASALCPFPRVIEIPLSNKKFLLPTIPSSLPQIAVTLLPAVYSNWL